MKLSLTRFPALTVLIVLMLSIPARSQSTYADTIRKYIADYIEKHEVVTGDDRKNLNFFPADRDYRVTAHFEKVKNGAWFNMETSGTTRQVYRVYGIIRFTIHDTLLTLNIYQSQRLMTVPEYKESLFLPFTDRTSGNESYATGRYIDLNFGDIVGDYVVIDFNKAYNPYCAYVSGRFNCPIPPKENNLNVAVRAGEMVYAGHH